MGYFTGSATAHNMRLDEMVVRTRNDQAGLLRDDRPGRRALTLRWAALSSLILALILIPFFLFEGPLTAWSTATFAAAQGRPLVSGGLIVLLLAGDAVLPVPSSIVSTIAGGVLGFAAGATAIWIGMTVGCVVSYGLGLGGGRGIARRVLGRGELERARRLLADVGPAALIMTRAVPVLGEAATLLAGAARMPFGTFMISTGVANLGIAFAYAGIGATAASSTSFLIGFIGLVSVPAIAWGGWRLFHARNHSALEVR